MSRCLTHPRLDVQAKEQRLANIVFFGGSLCFLLGTSQMDPGLFIMGFILLLGGSLLYLRFLEECYSEINQTEAEDTV